MPLLREEMTEINELYSQLAPTLTLEEAKRLQPHMKAVVMLLREMKSKHRLKRMNDKLDDLAMFITGEVKRIDEVE